MRKLFYIGLEAYQARYTYQLTDWNTSVFDQRGLDYKVVPGLEIDNTKTIQVGQVLDAHGRTFYSMHQMANLIQLMRNGEVTSEDAIFFEDMFTPGIESLAYIMNQLPSDQQPQIYVRCLAQTIDPDDFVHVWGMSKWMRKFEEMVNAMPNIHFLATNEEMVAHAKIAGWDAPIYNISGLAFGKKEVQSRFKGTWPTWSDKKDIVTFAARWDQEKQPHFYMDIVEELSKTHPHIQFTLLQGGKLRSNDHTAIDRARQLQAEEKLMICENLTKDMYYRHLAYAKVLFNCALQDWVSNTVSEADALGCNVLYPAYRSFPETFNNDSDRLYVPWSKEDAIQKLLALLEAPHPNMGLISDWNDQTVNRIVDIMLGNGEQWNRSASDYRKLVGQRS